MSAVEVGPIEARLRAARDAGRKLLVPYLTGGFPGWERTVEACAQAGADAIEVGIPFSDPVMDGPTIQEASERALAAGATPQDIVAAMGYWQERLGRRVSIEYTLLEGVNDSDAKARELAKVLRGLDAHVNLIPFNPWHGSGFGQSSRARTESFKATLHEKGMSVSVRFSRGRDAGGACGQLALKRDQAA